MEQAENTNKLKELGGSDYKIAKGESNIKGWAVKDARGQRLGEVEELIFDTESQKVRYIVLDIDANEFELEERKVLIPIGLAELHEEDDDVILPSVTTFQLQQLPAYDSDALNSEVESRIREIFSGVGLGYSAEAGSDYKDYDYYNEASLFKRRIKTTGNTVIGIFENGFDAQNGITKLKLGGFTEDQIDICVKDTSVDSNLDQDDTYLSSFFSSVLESKEQASHYTEVARQGAVVTVHARSAEDARNAAEILDQHGSIDMDSGYGTQANESATVGEKDQQIRARLRSKIIGRSVADGPRLRTGGPHTGGSASTDRPHQLW